MTKQEETQKELQSILADFLKEKNYGIFNDGFVSTHYTIRKAKKGSEFDQIKRIHESGAKDYFVETYLDSGYKDIGERETFFEFANYLLYKNHHTHLLQQLNKKVTFAESDIKPYMTSLIDLLGKNRSLLVKFFSKASLWEKETAFILPKVLAKLDSQSDKMQIFQSLFKSKSFSGIDKQAFVYPIFKAHIKNYKDFETLFNKIEINTAKESIFNFKQLNTLVFDVDFRLVLSKNLGTELSIEDYTNKFRHMLDRIIEENILPELKLKHLTYNKNKPNQGVVTYYISTESTELKAIQAIIEDVLSRVENLKTQKESFDLSPGKFIRESMIVARKSILDNMLEEQPQSTSNKMKI